MMLSLLVAFLSGVACLLLVELCLFVKWFRSKPAARSPPWDRQSASTAISCEEMAQLTSLNNELRSLIGSQESCVCLNVVFSMLFHEWKDSIDLKKFFIRKINAEIEELMFTKVVGKVLQQVKVHDYSFGPSLPFIRNATIQHMALNEQELYPSEIDIALDIDYRGGFHVSFDADVVFGRRAYVSVRVLKLVGRARFQMCCKPFSHWSLSFYDEPELDLDVKSQLEGRNFQQLSSMISNRFKKAIRKRHTLPAYKVRLKPFFRKPQPQEEANGIYVHDKKITVGKLTVEVREASHLPKALKAMSTYCTVEISSLSRKNHSWRIPVLPRAKPLEIEITRAKSESNIGAVFKMSCIETNDERRFHVVVDSVKPDSAASSCGLKKGDIVVSVGREKVTSSDHAARLVKHSGQTVLLSVRRMSPESAFETGKDSAGEYSSTSVAGRPQDGEVQESVEQEELLSTDQTVTATKLQSELLRQRKGHTNLRLSSEYRGDENVADGGGLSKPVSPPPDDFVYVDSPGCSCQTSAVPACSNTMWNELFEFDVGDTDRYLNISVWNQLQDLDRDLLIGHVSIPLMDIALQCLMTSSGSHLQHYVLVPAEPVKASRAEARATGLVVTSEDLPAHARYRGNRSHAGALFLSFRHSVAAAETTEEDDEDEKGIDEADGVIDSANQARISGRHVRGSGRPLRPQVQSSRHDFVSTQFRYAIKCDFCKKKIWTKKGKQCRSCSMKCHIKCLRTCRFQSACLFRESAATQTDINENSSTGRDGDENKHMPGDWGSCGKEITAELPLSGKDEATSMAPQAARQFGKELFAEVPPEIRREAINSKIAQLQEEMDREVKNLHDLRDRENATADVKQNAKLREEMKKLDDRRQALSLLMTQYLTCQEAMDNGDQEGELQAQIAMSL